MLSLELVPSLVHRTQVKFVSVGRPGLLLMCSWDTGTLPKDESMGVNGGRVNKGVRGLGPGVEEVAVLGGRLCLLQVMGGSL